MRFDILTIFPGMFAGPFEAGVVGRAAKLGRLSVHVHDLREHAEPPRRNVDDMAYGGGPGMVMRPEPLFRAVESVARPDLAHAVVLLSPDGQRLDQTLVRDLLRFEQLILIAGRYEGVDERVRQGLATHVLSIGDYVLTGGELPAMVLMDAVARLVPGVVGNEQSIEADPSMDGLLDHPHYTRPQEFRGLRVPEVLLSGDHERIRLWRRREALERTLAMRPELLAAARLSVEDRRLLNEIEAPRRQANQGG